MARIPIDISAGTLKATQIIVGIDLGTTNSLIARMHDGQPQCIADFGRDVIVPSILHFGPGGQVTVGEDARPYLATDPQRTLYSIKRLMGKSYADINPADNALGYRILDDPTNADRLVRVEVDGRYYTPVELSAMILKELKARAEHRLKTAITQAVITVPAYFNDAQRQATRDAGKLAGLDVLRILNEPTAAALAYGLGLRADQTQTVAVYDLGGGTFDVTLLRIEGGVFEVLATHGDTHLGGDDFDRLILDHYYTTHATLPAADRPALRLVAEQAKRALGTEPQYQTQYTDSAGHTHDLAISAEQFRALAQPLLERTLQSCRAALTDAELRPQDVEHVLLVGGATRMPIVKEAVQALFGRKPSDELHPDEVVALGAAVQADILAGNRQDLLLLDVTPLSLGLETAGGLMDTLIPRNSKVPTRASRQYTTQVDGQNAMRITVYQGERELVAHNRRLAEMHLRGIPAMPAGLPKVEVSFVLDADGILRVEAQELRSGIRQHIDVKPSYGLTDAEVETMLLASLQNAQQDVSTRMVAEAQQEGRSLVYHAQKFVDKYQADLSDEEQAETRRLIAQLEAAIAAADASPTSQAKDAIHAALDALDHYTQPFAQRVMSAALREAMVGKAIES